MSTEITEQMRSSYHASIMLLAQQKKSRLRSRVLEGTQAAKKDFWDRVGDVTAQEKTTRHADTTYQNTPHDRRMITLRDYFYADLVDNPDKIRVVADPTNAYVQAAVAAFNRRIDDTIIAAAEATAYSGEEGDTAVAFDNTNQNVAVDYVETGSAANSNMTIAKLRQARYIMDNMVDADSDDEEPQTLVMGPSQKKALLATTEVTNRDYNIVQALYEGKLNHYMGFDIVWSKRLGLSSTTRTCLFFTQSGIRVAFGQEMKVRLTEMANKHYSTQIYVDMCIGGTRMEETKVGRIKCDESA